MTRGAAVLLVLACAAAALGGDGAKPADDSVTWMEGGAKKTRAGVTVESAGFDQVIFSQGGRRTTLDGADVVEVRYGDAPRDFDSGAAALRAGEGDAAAASFSAALSARATTRGWLVERGAAGLAESFLLTAGRDARSAEKAAHAFGTARDANPKSLLLDRILGGLARADLILGQADAALQASDDLAAAAAAARRPLWEIDALVLRARALDAKRDVAGALRALDAAVARGDAASAATKDADAARRLRRAAVHAAARRAAMLVAEAEATRSPEAVERARAAGEAVVAKWPDEGEAQAAATNAAGALLLLAGDARKALRKFVETEVVHFDATDEAARALWYVALCQERLGDKKARVETLRRLVASYPESVEAGRDDVKAVTAPR